MGFFTMPDLFDPREWAFEAIGSDYQTQHAMYEHLHQFLERNPNVTVLDTLDNLMNGPDE